MGTSTSKAIIEQQAQNLSELLRSIRHHIHMHPELSMQEKFTAQFISQHLTKWGIEHTDGWAGNGIVAIVHGTTPGPCIALRADMDALPIQETNEKPYKSKIPGVMHACGHDVHSTCLLGAAKILIDNRDKFKGCVKLIFQPSEEKLPGGASIMIEEGVLENPKPESIVALHVYPALPTGEVGFRAGMYMASCDEIYLTIRGKGGHAAIPKGINNPLFIAAHALIRLKTLSERFAVHDVPTVLQFGKIVGAGATNVVPDVVSVEGTFRTMEESWRYEAHQQIRDVVSSVANENNCDIECNIQIGYPYLKNDSDLTARCKNAAAEYLGQSNVKSLDIRMASEDFSYYSQKIPACFFRLGTGNEALGITSPVHTSTFDIDEDALAIGAGLMSFVALNLLSSAS